MNRLKSKMNNSERRKNRVRTKVRGKTQRPRLSVHVSSRHISAQIIDDQKNATIAQATTVGLKSPGTMSEKAEIVGSLVAKKAITKKVKKVALDRGSRLYHGRVKALAEAARKEGLEF